MTLSVALAIVDFVVDAAPAPVCVFVVDAHGEIVAAATMDDAPPESRLNARRKAYTAARSGYTSTRELGDRVDSPARAVSFDPFFTFLPGGVAAFLDDKRVGAVGVSGVSGVEDDALARRALAAVGMTDHPSSGD